MNVFVTGGARGIGLSTVQILLERGCRVIAGVRDVAAADTAFSALPTDQLSAVHLDLAHPDTIGPAVQEVLARMGSVQGLVNNAGISNLGAVEDQPDDEFERIMKTNFYGHYQLTRALLPHMRKQDGARIVMVSSLSGLFGLPGESAYCCSKFAMEAMAECLRFEVAPFGIRVAVVNPSYTRTELAARTDLNRATPATSPYRALMEALLIAQQDGEQNGDPIELVAEAIADALLSEEPRFRYLPGGAAELYEAWKQQTDEGLYRMLVQALDLNGVSSAAQ